MGLLQCNLTITKMGPAESLRGTVLMYYTDNRSSTDFVISKDGCISRHFELDMSFDLKKLVESITHPAFSCRFAPFASTVLLCFAGVEKTVTMACASTLSGANTKALTPPLGVMGCHNLTLGRTKAA
ncbi:hypothetical protein TNCV_2195481 [Trichonephila clavipes]|uniref:Uncharacterized protein n=1 Tax=Trichonephila clavipes TaxID=2585209 RepID=A0A8X6SB51_TRICX|nr:hypothetical protein TNCV_2195481 [Trichonephila clavipes]